MPYWRISGFYLFYFATLGAFAPYWSLYLKSLHFSPAQIGELMAVPIVMRIIAPNVWGWLSDRSGWNMRIVRLASLLAALTFVGVFFGQSYGWLALILALFSFFWSASLPQLEANTLNHLGGDTHRYSTIRSWGSIGFILSVVILGPLFDRFGMGLLPGILCSLLIGIWIASLLVPEPAARAVHADHEPLGKVLRRPEVMAFLFSCFLMSASHGPYYTFYSIYLQDHGYSRSLIGQLWALGVVAEIGIFLTMHRLAPRFGLRGLLLASLILATLRWILIALFVNSFAVLIFAQILHAATFGIFHATAIQLVHGYFSGKHQVRGQALYSSLGFGVGGAVGSLYSGYLWASGGPVVTFLLAALLSGSACGVVWFALRTRA